MCTYPRIEKYASLDKIAMINKEEKDVIIFEFSSSYLNFTKLDQEDGDENEGTFII